MAWFELAHARLTVNAGTWAGCPERSMTSRAMLGAWTEWTTVP
jgi:hypothetical protein